MVHSFYKVWIHPIWFTKDRMPLIIPSLENKFHGYMRQQFTEAGCIIRIINGMPDHVHCLFSLNPQKSFADIIKQVKGSSSHWVNHLNVISDKFSWQTGYAACSVSESQIDKVFQYISQQKQHHQTKTYQQEFDAFLKLYGLDK